MSMDFAFLQRRAMNGSLPMLVVRENARGETPRVSSPSAEHDSRDNGGACYCHIQSPFPRVAGARQLDVPELPPGVIYTQAAAGPDFSLLCRSDGEVVLFGDGWAAVPARPAEARYTKYAPEPGVRSEGLPQPACAETSRPGGLARTVE